MRTDGGSLLPLDGQAGFGQVVGQMAASQEMVSIHFVNVISRLLVAPWGGSNARFGTSPFAVGIPVEDGEPVVLDLATSVMAQGKARIAGEPERESRARRLAEGVPVDAATWDELLAIAARLGHDPARMNQLAGVGTAD